MTAAALRCSAWRTTSRGYTMVLSMVPRNSSSKARIRCRLSGRCSRRSRRAGHATGHEEVLAVGRGLDRAAGGQFSPVAATAFAGWRSAARPCRVPGRECSQIRRRRMSTPGYRRSGRGAGEPSPSRERRKYPASSTASTSASERWPGPARKSRSRGRSCTGQCLIELLVMAGDCDGVGGAAQGEKPAGWIQSPFGLRRFTVT